MTSTKCSPKLSTQRPLQRSSAHVPQPMVGTRWPRLGAAMLLTGLAWSPIGQAATVQVTVTSRDGKPLPDAVVTLLPAQSAAKPLAPVQATVQQVKSQFVPALLVVPVGSTVRFVNMDSYDHHVRGRSTGLAGLNAAKDDGLQLRLAGQEEGKPPSSGEDKLTEAGPLQLGCHLHASMRGHLFVANSAWTVATDANGVANFQDVPEGAAKVQVWHPDQLIDAAATPANVTSVTALTLPTQVQPRKRRP